QPLPSATPQSFQARGSYPEISRRARRVGRSFTLPSPKPAYPWHIPGTPNLSSTQSWHTVHSDRGYCRVAFGRVQRIFFSGSSSFSVGH
ncbi:MAG: hypothetical protein ACYCVU_09025, partial [Gammaproteobacteria bacterium]